MRARGVAGLDESGTDSVHRTAAKGWRQGWGVAGGGGGGGKRRYARA